MMLKDGGVACLREQIDGVSDASARSDGEEEEKSIELTIVEVVGTFVRLNLYVYRRKIEEVVELEVPFLISL